MSGQRFVNDPGIAQSPSFVRGGTGGSGGRSGGSDFGDVLKGIGTIFDVYEKDQNTSFANQVSINTSEATQRLIGGEPSLQEAAAQGAPQAAPEVTSAQPGTATAGQGENQLQRRWEAVQQRKMSETQFYAWASSHLRTEINRNPQRAAQFREVFKSVTGFDPDERLRTTLFNQEAQRLQAQKEEEGRWRTMKNDAANLGISQEIISQGDKDLNARSQVEQIILQRKSNNATRELELKRLEQNDKLRTAGANDAFELANRQTDQVFNEIYSDSFAQVAGFSYNDLVKKAQAAGADGSLSPQEQQEIAKMFTQFRGAVNLRVSKLLNEPFGEDKRSFAARIGDVNKVKQIQARLTERLDQIEQAVTNKDFGLLSMNKAAIEAIEQGDKLRVLFDPNTSIFREMSVIPREGLAAWLAQSGNLERLDKALKGVQFDAQQTVRLGAAGGGVNSGTPLSRVLEDNKHPDPQKNAQVANAVIGAATQQLIDPKTTPEAAAKIATSLFSSDQSIDFMKNLNAASKEKVFKTLATPEMSAKIMEMAKGNPEIGQRYGFWVLNNASNILKVQSDTIKEYLRPPSGYMERLSTGSGPLTDLAPISFNGREFVLSPIDQQAMRARQTEGSGNFMLQTWQIQRWYDGAQQSITKINDVLKGVMPVIEAQGGDPNMVLQTLFQGTDILKIIQASGAQATPAGSTKTGDNVNMQIPPGIGLPTSEGGTPPESQNIPVPPGIGIPTNEAGTPASAGPGIAQQALDVGRYVAQKVAGGVEFLGKKIAETNIDSEIERLTKEADAYRASSPQAARNLIQQANALRVATGRGGAQADVPPETSGKGMPTEYPQEAGTGTPERNRPNDVRARSKEVRTKLQGTETSPVISQDQTNEQRRRVNNAPDSGKVRDPVIENLERQIQNDPVRAMEYEARIRDLTAAKETRVVETGDNAGVRWRPNNRAREAFRSIDLSKTPPTVKGLLDNIGQVEARNDYNAVWMGLRNSKFSPPKNVTEMTLGEVMAYQQDVRNRGAASTAVGKYQFISGTLAGLQKELGLDTSLPFNSELQDKLAIRLLQKRGLDRYLTGSIDEDTFIRSLSQEWAALPNTTGRSFYDKDGLNKSLIPLEKWREFVRKMRGQGQGPNQ